MVAIGRAMMSRPKLLLLDEPSLGLAPLVVSGIFQTIRLLRGRGTTILLVEQNAKAALRVADRGYVLETGRIILEGETEDLLNNKEVQRAYLGKEYREVWE
jgi:branched-chain amino acid transport system ATP-binding protein